MSNDAPWFAKAIQPALAAFIVLATVSLFTFFVYSAGHQDKINPEQKEIIIYILGVLSAAVTQILGYYFGSSSGSAQKSKSLDVALQTARSEK